MLTAALTALAIVSQDASALRAAPSDAAPQQAQLWQGDLLEVRGRRVDHLQVWDHRRERAGYVRATQVKLLDTSPAAAPQLLAVMRFLRDQPGAEPLGIAYAAAYFKAAPALDSEAFDALGTFAERLARRASQRSGGAVAAAHLEVAAQYGVRFASYEREGAMQLCYDGEAFRRVLAMNAGAEAKARAALAVTRPDCLDPAQPPLARQQHDAWRAEVLARIGDAEFALLPAPLQNRLRLRRAGLWSQLAFDAARSGQPAAALAQQAIDALAGVDKNELADDDHSAYAEAALRVGASRWAALPVLPMAGKLAVRTEAGEPGQTCVLLQEANAVVARRCTYGVAWLASAKADAGGQALALAVQPLAGWRELWVFRRGAGGWSIDVLPPAATEPNLGYVEFAGFVPGGQKLLLAREVQAEGRFKRSFEVWSLETMAVERQASTPSLLVLFGKWQDPAWKRQTVSLR